MKLNIEFSEELETDYEKKIKKLNDSIQEKNIFLKKRNTLLNEMKKGFVFSDFISDACINNPLLLMDLFESGDLERTYNIKEYAKKVSLALNDTKNDAETGKELRRLRQREMVRIAWRDLNGHSTLSETVSELSAFADACIEGAVFKIHTLLEKEFGTPTGPDGRPLSLIVLGMGKLGACELNFSSDVDLVFIYPEIGVTSPNHLTNEEFFIRLARRFIKIIGEVTADGIVFRVDLRLRPYGDSGPLIMSIDALEDYFLAQGREWERYAYIKARAICGASEDVDRLEGMLHSFVYRRYLDYASFDSLREMKQNIVNEVKRKGLKNNIKIGTGGIREIEFFGQIFQLIRGGVEPELRERKILEILEILSKRDYIQQETKQELSEAYTFLRYTEHRLQEFSDAQIHILPKDKAGQFRLAVSMGFKSWGKFKHNLDSHMNKVHHHFNQILANVDSHPESSGIDESLKNTWQNLEDKEQALRDFKKVGFVNPGAIYKTIECLKNDPNTRALSREGRKRVNKLIPVILNKVANEKDATVILDRIADFIKTIERRTCYIALLVENPPVIDRLIKLASESSWIISYLTMHPVLLDELIDIRFLNVPPEKKKMVSELKERMEKVPPDELEYQIVEMCIFKQVNTLHVAASDISGVFPLIKVSDYLTDIAEIILESVYEQAWKNLSEKFGEPSSVRIKGNDHSGFAIIGFGKLGGIELGYASDLDLVFIHSAEDGETRGGKKSIDNKQFYYRLGQKIIHLITARTSAGILYEVDMRLRPSGNSGMIVSHIDSFAEYYQKSAWIWEHQALVRARPICGDESLFKKFNGIRRNVLCKKRKKKDLLKEILEMREKMRKEKGNQDKKFYHLKQDKGGIVDIEFLVQYLVLRNAYTFPEITEWTDNIRLLLLMSEKGIIDKKSAIALKNRYLLLRSKTHKLNLQEKPPIVPVHEFKENINTIMEIQRAYMS